MPLRIQSFCVFCYQKYHPFSIFDSRWGFPSAIGSQQTFCFFAIQQNLIYILYIYKRMKEDTAKDQPLIMTNYLQLTLTSDDQINTKLIQILHQQSILLLRQQQYENYFKNCEKVQKIVFVFAMQVKSGDADAKPKQRIIGRIKPIRNCYEIDWDLISVSNMDDQQKEAFTHFCEVEWNKKLEVSKNKLPSEYHQLYGKKDGFHQISALEGCKLHDLVEYPCEFYKKIYPLLKDQDYLVHNSDSSSDDSDSDSSDSDSSSSSSSSSDSERSSRNRQRRRKDSRKRRKSKDKNRHRKRSGKGKNRSKSKDRKGKNRHDKDKSRRRNRSNDRKRDKSKDRNKRKDEKKSKGIKKQQKNKHPKDKKRDRQEEKGRRKGSYISEKDQKQKNKHKDKQRDKQKKQREEKEKRKTPILNQGEKKLREQEGKPEKKVKGNDERQKSRDVSRSKDGEKKKIHDRLMQREDGNSKAPNEY